MFDIFENYLLFRNTFMRLYDETWDNKTFIMCILDFDRMKGQKIKPGNHFIAR